MRTKGPSSRLHVQVTVVKLGEDDFRIARLIGTQAACNHARSACNVHFAFRLEVRVGFWRSWVNRMKESVQSVRIEPRWPVVLTSIAVLILVLSLPVRVRAFPGWVPYLLIIPLNVPMVALALATDKRRWLAIEHFVMLFFFAGLGFAVADEVRYLVASLVRRSSRVDGLQLLTSGVVVWASNVLLFSLAYWRIDRGGPEARLNQPDTKPDWVFPQQENVALRDKNLTFVDYLFLAYWTGIAFSPTDALPLSSRAKLLMMLESMISLVTIIVVVARAISIIGS